MNLTLEELRGAMDRAATKTGQMQALNGIRPISFSVGLKVILAEIDALIEQRKQESQSALPPQRPR
jgi:hypothetical protein